GHRARAVPRRSGALAFSVRPVDAHLRVRADDVVLPAQTDQDDDAGAEAHRAPVARRGHLVLPHRHRARRGRGQRHGGVGRIDPRRAQSRARDADRVRPVHARPARRLGARVGTGALAPLAADRVHRVRSRRGRRHALLRQLEPPRLEVRMSTFLRFFPCGSRSVRLCLCLSAFISRFLRSSPSASRSVRLCLCLSAFMSRFLRSSPNASRSVRLCLCLSAFMPALAYAQGFTIERALGYPYPYGLTAAAHAARIAWVFNVRGSRNVWVADGPAFTGRQLTHYTGDDGMPIASLKLTPNGNTVVYARGSETNAQGEVADPTSDVHQPEQQVWAADVSNGEPRLLGTMNCGFEGCEDIQISPDGRFAVWSARHALWLAPISGAQPARQLAYIRGDNAEPQWSPDGKAIAFTSNRGEYSLIGIYRFDSRTLQYVDPSVFRDMLPRWSADGSKLAFIRLTGGRGGFFSGRLEPWTIWVWDAASGKASQIWASASDANGSYPGEWESDAFQFAAANRIVFASQADGWVHLYSIPAAGGAPLLLTPGAFSFQGGVTLTPDGTTLLYASNQNDIDRRHIWRVDVDRAGPVALTHGASIEWTPVATGASIACLGSSATTPAMPYRVTPQGREPIAASAMPNDYPSAQLVAPQQVVFKSLDGLEIHGQLFVPQSHAQRSPALVFMHGGPPRQMMLGFHPMDAYNFMYAANEYLASRGFVVLS